MSYAACVCMTFLRPVARGLHSIQCFESSAQRRPNSSTLDGKPETVTRPGHSIVILFKILSYVFVGKSPLFLYNYYVYAYLIINQSRIIFYTFLCLILGYIFTKYSYTSTCTCACYYCLRHQTKIMPKIKRPKAGRVDSSSENNV